MAAPPTPLPVENRPGLSALAYRVGDYPSFREAMVESLARAAGAGQIEVRAERLDRTAPVAAGWGEEVFLECELIYTATGRPASTEITGRAQNRGE